MVQQTLADLLLLAAKHGPTRHGIQESQLAKVIADGITAGTGVPNGGTTGQLLAKLSNADQDTGWIDPPSTAGNPTSLAYFDSNTGILADLPGFTRANSGGLAINLNIDVEDAASGAVHNPIVNLIPIEDSPNTAWNHLQLLVNLDPDSSGFDIGTAGQAARQITLDYQHLGTSDTGSLDYLVSNFQLGNGTDPISVRGWGYAYGFGTVNSGVTIDGPMQGYGYQPNIQAGAVLTANAYSTAFYDTATIAVPLATGYQSFNSSPTLFSIPNNNNVQLYNANPQINGFVGNAGFTGYGLYGSYAAMNPGSGWRGLEISPQSVALAHYAAGLQVSMDGVTPYAGVQSTLTEQDLTFTFVQPGDNDNYTLEYTTGATAGAEVVSMVGTDITVQIEDGVSTATQIKAAWDAVPALVAAVTATITGIGGNAQDAFGPSNFQDGEWPGNVYAAYLDGDVEITGDVNIQGGLSFGGALSIGKLTAFAAQAVVDGGGVPASIHSLISSPTVAANATLTTGDTIGVNTAALISIGDNATVGTAFLGIAALALPAVVTMGAGSTLDRASGATFAVSLDVGATGGTINELALCRGLALPNGTTTINRLYGFQMELPFGDPGTDTWGIYINPEVPSYFSGSVVIGEDADLPTNSSVALEFHTTTRAPVAPRLTTTQRDALTALQGMFLFNTSTSKFQGYDGATWQDFH